MSHECCSASATGVTGTHGLELALCLRHCMRTHLHSQQLLNPGHLSLHTMHLKPHFEQQHVAVARQCRTYTNLR